MPDGSTKCRPRAAAWSPFTSLFSLKRHPNPFYSGSSKPWVRRRPWICRKRYVYWEDLQLLFNREWIRRVWTYQEILLASRPVLVCGNSHLSWDGLERSTIFLCKSFASYRDCVVPWRSIILERERLSNQASDTTRLELQEHDISIEKILRVLLNLELVMMACTGILVIASINLGLAVLIWYPFIKEVLLIASGFLAVILVLSVLYIFSTLSRAWFALPIIASAVADDLMGGLYRRDATELKDMAYGLWAILHRKGATDLPEPLYDREIGQIYWTLTAQLIHTTKSLDFLFFAAVKRQPGVPSWVPDWSVGKQTT
ncbi:hypothetical protein CC80DRAFT_29068 [Byssothecium circinans]|uniref:Heterokaryon incompatibility domain-containing protein n=1 Tax=Byssothecium circinans TaxID=147558 RepID=A0A6A5U5R0_9PLEO|nr:hypothetical protein CC80DRAFT_29068 [Byssothecium circinans]